MVDLVLDRPGEETLADLHRQLVESDPRTLITGMTILAVLVLAAGSQASLAQLIAWLRVGPPMARVDAVEVEDIDPATQEWPAGFQQR